MGRFRVPSPRLGYFSQNFAEQILLFHFVWSPPVAPATVFELFRIQNMLCAVVDDATCDTSVDSTWRYILTVNRHYESYFRSNMSIVLGFVILTGI